MKPFWDLLPYRVEQALTAAWFRRLRIKYRRRNSASQLTPTIQIRRRLFVDLAVISRHDAGTGIQRVVRSLALALIEEGAKEWDLHFVAADRRRSYHTISWPGSVAIIDSTAIEGRPGDVFLGLDFSLDTIRRYRQQLIRFRRDGGQFWFLICDLLPLEKPEWFSANNVTRYKAWLDTIVSISDGFLCISAQTDSDLKRVLGSHYGLTDGYRTSIVPMGYDIRESLLDRPALEGSPVFMRFDTSMPFSLMVGTLEPRKGHADILAAFSELWRQGAESRLVIVGRIGWQIAELRNAICTHPQYGGRLLWFDDVDDLELERIYQACDGVIIASYAEGFGLPLIEALGHGKPVLARDLPIFAIHKDSGVRYFPSDAGPYDLARCIDRWTRDVQARQIKVVPPRAGWQDSVRALLSAIA